jgi:hypothetical protein
MEPKIGKSPGLWLERSNAKPAANSMLKRKSESYWNA